MHQVLEGRFSGERVVQDLLKHSKGVDVVQHWLQAYSVVGLPSVQSSRLPSSLLRGAASLDISRYDMHVKTP